MNNVKMSRKFICSMAMPLAMMFAAFQTSALVACSDDKSVSGGASEEPSVYALKDITVAARAYYARTLESDGGSGEIAVSAPSNLFLYGGEARLSELDTVTLEPLDSVAITANICTTEPDTLTGEVTNPCDEGTATGSFKFKDITLKSPVVLIEAVAGEVSLKAIVDVRDSGSFAIDAMSHLAYYRIANLVASGSSFAAAKTQAESELMSAFAFGESPAIRQAALSEGVPYDLLEKVGEEFGAAGSVAGLSDSTRRALETSIEGLNIFTVVQFSPWSFERRGEGSAQYYQECLQKKTYYANLLASVFEHGTCSAEKEGTFADISGNLFELMCASGSWDIALRERNGARINHTFGTMTDARDGKVYKTVTLDLDGMSQTWMAENLKYEAEGSFCFDDECFEGVSSNSSIGRMYSFVSMLDSAYFKGAWEDEDGYVDYDSVKWDMIADSLDVLNFNMCPEGWHVARYEEWETLFSYLRNNFGAELGKETNWLMQSFGNPTGFGMDMVARVRGANGWFKIQFYPMKYLFAPTFLPESALKPEVSMSWAGVFGTIVSYSYSGERLGSHSHFVIEHYYGPATTGFVRCVMD
ncbi:FISUMP domain-containing protein [Fibrobacter sp. UWR2]|uniref:FISUMP domain-containing protein n=1 Tax=Fibrobacter sp. UWR2 TaxID=1964352 RepID=UPI000B5242BD|nr:FISUMP domain-containing protein [Fibrobacter sp. UWR2]OWV00642.1 hypothetical protein B7994_06170 [Fibrobacter sp. UWR2]